jgi:putative MATE family efflux protein|tara:strand:+ start:684 stop:2069 length:1386 start_codon:yes stop_codon:yes gene_type:complete
MSNITDDPGEIDEPGEIPHPESLSVWGLAWPSILNNLLFASVGLVAIKAVGSLGAEAVAAVGTGQRIFWVFQALLMAIMAGTTALVARSIGGGNPVEAAQVTRASLGLCLLISVITALIFWLGAEQMIGAFGLDEVSQELSIQYTIILVTFTPVFAISMVLSTAQRAAGDTKTPLYIAVFTNILNIFLLVGLVNGRFGMPDLGIVGAALAAGISFTFNSFVVLFLWFTKRLAIETGTPGSMSKERMKQLFSISYPAGMESFIFQFGMLAFFWIVALYGTDAVAAYNIGTNVLMLSFTVGMGFAIAGSTLTGQYLGASDPDGAYDSAFKATSLTMLSMGSLGIILAIFSRDLATFFIDDPDVVSKAVVFVWILGIMQPFMALQFSLGGAVRGAGDTKSPLIITLIGLVLVRVPLAILVYKLGLPVEWIFATLIADYFIQGVLLIIRFRSRRWMKVLNTDANS